MGTPVKVFLAEGEGAGWAVDQDLELTRRALMQIPDKVELVSFEEADVVHSVWDYPYSAKNSSWGQGKYHICHICTDFYKMLENPSSLRARGSVDLWVAQTKACSESLKMNVILRYHLVTLGSLPKASKTSPISLVN